MVHPVSGAAQAYSRRHLGPLRHAPHHGAGSARRVRDENAQRQIGDDTRAQALLDADMALLVER